MRHGLRFSVLAVFMLCGCFSRSAQQDISQNRLQLGLLYLSRADYSAAQRNLSRAITIAPDDYRNRLAMAYLHQAQGENALAKQQYQIALRLAPDNGFVLNNYGVFLCHLGQYNKAFQYFTLAGKQASVKIKADSLENAGYCYFSQGNYPAAEQALTQAVHADRQKGTRILAQAGKWIDKGARRESQLLLEIYHHSLPASAESLWLKIRSAALDKRVADIKRYGTQLAQSFSQSIQYQHYLANEY